MGSMVSRMSKSISRGSSGCCCCAFLPKLDITGARLVHDAYGGHAGRGLKNKLRGAISFMFVRFQQDLWSHTQAPCSLECIPSQEDSIDACVL